MSQRYLVQHHETDIIEILRTAREDKHFSINVNFLELFESDPNLGNSVLNNTEEALKEWNDTIDKAQKYIISQAGRPELTFKSHVHCRIFGLPLCPELHRTIFPKNEDAGKFLQVSGTVVRMSAAKMLEFQRQYICAKCRFPMTVDAEYEKKNAITPPRRCTSPEGCGGTNIITLGELDANFCKDYQEIKMQESTSTRLVGCMPSSIWVTLEDDLVDSCKPGDNITVCGIVKRRWNPFYIGKKVEMELVLKANHVQVNNNNNSASLITPEAKSMFEGFWETYAHQPLAARDIILKSICPQLFGLHLVKLAVAVVLAGGSQVQDDVNTGVRLRSEPHLLLVGDPGTGKSQILRFASRIIPRSVLTTGVGSTAAGLTVTAVMEEGEWQLEGGALVLSDGGICCIDEFNSMAEHDRTSIHEAMEQQTISVAKASIVCKLNTRCSILAATNPKGNVDPTQPLNMNIALASPLLSRFDLILIMRDKVNVDWDSLLTDYILNSQSNRSKLTDNIFWTTDMLQSYFAVIKKNHPILTDEANKILSAYYQAQRRRQYRNKSRTTVRLLDSLVRLSQGHARIMYHHEVEVVDAVMAISLVEISMNTEDSSLGLSFDVQSDFPTCPMSSYRELVSMVLQRLSLPDVLERELERIDEKLSKSKKDQPYRSNAEQAGPERPTIGSKYFNIPAKCGTEENPSVSDNNTGGFGRKPRAETCENDERKCPQSRKKDKKPTTSLKSDGKIAAANRKTEDSNSKTSNVDNRKSPQNRRQDIPCASGNTDIEILCSQTAENSRPSTSSVNESSSAFERIGQSKSFKPRLFTRKSSDVIESSQTDNSVPCTSKTSKKFTFKPKPTAPLPKHSSEATENVLPGTSKATSIFESAVDNALGEDEKENESANNCIGMKMDKEPKKHKFKKFKPGFSKRDNLNDFDMIKLIPSVNDAFVLPDFEMEDIESEFTENTDGFNNEATHNIFNKTGNNYSLQQVTNNDKIEDKSNTTQSSNSSNLPEEGEAQLSQKSKRRKILNRFRFQPKLDDVETKNTGDKSTGVAVVPSSSGVPSFSTHNTMCSDIFESPHDVDDLDLDF